MTVQSTNLAHAQCFPLGSAVVEPALRLIRGADGAEARVEPRVMQVLVALAATKGTLLSRDDLRHSCWSGRVTSDDAVDRVIAHIRRLGENVGGGSFTVETVAKVGYRLVEEEGPSGHSTAWLSRRGLVGAGIGGVALLAGGAALYSPLLRRKALADGMPVTIAVLPFTSESTSAQLASFAAELSDEVRSDISRVGDIRVIAQTSNRDVAKHGGTASQIGRSLGAHYLIEGQVGSASGRIVATVALVDTADGSQLWTASESAPQRDPTGLRPAVAGDLVQQLAGILPISTTTTAAVKRPDPQAYALVQQANRLMEDARTGSMRGRRSDSLAIGQRAEQLAHQALAIDPNDGGALAVLAAVTRNGWTPALAKQDITTEQRVQASIAIIKRALLADPSNPAALTQLGDYYRRFAFRWSEAETLFRRALAIDPSFVDAHWSYGYELGTLGRAVEGLDHALSVFELDPRNPFRRIALPRLLYLLGQRDAAMRRYDAELKEQPDNLFLLRELYFMFLSEGNASALAGLSNRISSGKARTAEVDALWRRVETGRLALAGQPTQLRAMIDADVKDYDRPNAVADATPQGRARDDLPFIFAIEYAWAGLPERAIDMLDRALAAKSLYWPATLPFGIAQFPNAVRDNPRFGALWDRDPGLREMVVSRRRAVLSGQMAGFTPDGRKVTPLIPSVLAKRVRSALAMPSA